MAGSSRLPKWAPRLSPSTLRRLYETDALGIVDAELIDEVAFGLLARCESVLAVTAAQAGTVTCPECAQPVRRDKESADEVLLCPICGWTTTWTRYHSTYRRRQLFGGAGTPVFAEFVARFPTTRSPQERMILVDWLVHQCHVSATQRRAGLAGRPIAINLIDAPIAEVLALLDALAYGPDSTADAADTRTRWRETVMSAYQRRPAREPVLGAQERQPG